MNKSTVIEVLEETYRMCIEKVNEKGEFYHHNEDRLAHLRATAISTGLSTARSIHSLMSKHFTALPDMIDNSDSFSMNQLDEYLIDILVYTGYLRCILLEEKDLVSDVPFPVMEDIKSRDDCKPTAPKRVRK